MVKILIGASLFIIGVLCGMYGYYVTIHSQVNHANDASELISKVLPYSEQKITEENYSCEGNGNRKVGGVLASIVGGGQAYKVNAIAAGCSEGVCSVVLNSCKPWQSSECGSRMLVFSQDSSGNIVPSSFKCLDIP